MYTKILVGYDGSDRALRAVEEAADLATAVGARLHLVAATPREEQIHEIGDSSEKRFLSDSQIARDMLLNVAAKFDHLVVTTAAVPGDPAQVLVEEAKGVDADLIIVGNRHVQGISVVLGSVAEGVAQKAPCAVLISKTL